LPDFSAQLYFALPLFIFIIMNKTIYHDNVLRYGGDIVPFVIKTTKEMREIAATPHSHSYYMIYWPSNSIGKHIIDQNEYPLEPDRIYFIKPGQIHQIITSPKPAGTFIFFTPEFFAVNSIRGDFISNLELFNNSEETISLSTHTVNRLKEYVQAMMNAFLSSGKLKYDIIESYLKLFLVECNEQYSFVANNTTADSARENALTLTFKSLVDEHFGEWRLVKNYADKMNITSNYLSEVVKRGTGQPPKAHIQARLALEAKRLLLFTGLSIKEIGFELGFDDPARFSRFFKDSTGMSLQSFRKSNAT
jgi:AraC family transcriptional regulator, transcriptional activator of pobA